MRSNLESHAATLTPPSDISNATRDDPRVAEALVDYLDQCRAGQRPNRSEFLARYDAIRHSLVECLDGLDFVESAVGNASRFTPGPPSSDAPEPASTRTVLGDFRLVREIGRGGMGVVFEAEQLSLGRRVALKVLPFAAALDPRQRQRFQVEAQAAACLHHTHIVPVFAVGCDRGTHYYAMQFIEGRTVADIVAEMRLLQQPRGGQPAAPLGAGSTPAHASQIRPESDADLVSSRITPDPDQPTAAPSLIAQRQAPATSAGLVRPTGSATLCPGVSDSNRSRDFVRAVARLGVEAASALEHAHSLGILHRDIKPSNLMVDTHGSLWITDFGLARVQADLGLTQTGDLLGTLRYMSPEQALARHAVLDQRSDIYSLGATLFELLTLRPVFEGRDRNELIHEIVEQDPTPPRTLNSAVPRDLETIILKALAKEPAARYANALQMADDLRSFLDDKPILARRPGPIARLSKLARRHRAVVTTAIVSTFLALMTALGYAVVKERQISHEKDRLTAALQEKNRALSRLNAVLFDVSKISDRVVFPFMGKLAYAGKATKDDYHTAIAYYDQLSNQTRNNDELRIIAARADRRAGYLRTVIMDSPAWEDTYRRSIVLFKQVIAAKPPDVLALRGELADTLDEFANWFWTVKRVREGEPNRLESIALRNSLADDAPTNASLVMAATRATLQHARWLDSVGRRSKVEALLKPIERRADRIAAIPWDARARTELLTDIAKELGSFGRRESALHVLTLAAQSGGDDPARDAMLAWLLVNRPADQPPYDPSRARGLAESVTRASPDQPLAWKALALAHLRLGEFDAAEAAIAKVSSNDPELDVIKVLISAKRGKTDDATAAYGQLVGRMKQMRQPSPDLQALVGEAAASLGLPDPRAYETSTIPSSRRASVTTQGTDEVPH
jgi:serine/threonine protein kinase/Flp pilus assembly protein TadD